MAAMPATSPLKITFSQRRKLLNVLEKRTLPHAHARRIRVVLLAAEGISGVEIARRVGMTAPQVSRVRRRFMDGGVEGLEEQPRPGRPKLVPEKTVRRIVTKVMSPPPAGYSHWSCALLAREVGHGTTTVHRILKANDLKPHLTATFKVSKDPRFDEKAADVVGLYLNPPEKAVVISLDEKTQVQALDRTQPMLPLRTGQVERHTHDYRRNGVVDLYAALEVATGRVIGKCTESHTGVDFLAFVKRLARTFPKRELHVILDNSSTHSTPDVQAWLAANPRVTFHFTPTSASWMNQVEGFFSILTRRSIRRTSFPTKAALRRHIDEFLARWNENPTPFVWTKSVHSVVRDHRRHLARISGMEH
jgi:transposase